MGCYSTGLITDPFTHDLDILLLATNGVVLLEDVAHNLICSTEIGQQQMNNFVEERININSVGFWELITNINIQMCSNVNEKIGVKSSNKLIIVNQQGLVWQAELSFKLFLVAYSFGNHDGSLRKGVKGTLCSLWEKGIPIVHQLTASTNPKVVLILGIAVLQMKKYSVADTFDEFSEKDFNIFSTSLFSNDCLQVHMVFDQYWVNSIEGDEHQQRGASIGLKAEIRGTASSKTMLKVYHRSKKQGIAWII